MPELILKFTLPEDQIEAETAVKAGAWKDVVWQLDEHLRSKTKHEPLTVEQYAAYSELREKIHQLMDNEGLRFE